MEIQSIGRPFSSKLSRSQAAAWRYLRGGPGHFLMYVFGRFQVVRSLVLGIYRLRSSKVATCLEPPLVERVDVDHAARLLARDGLFPELRLRPATLDALRQFSGTSTCFAEENSQIPFNPADKLAAEENYHRKISVGRLDHALEACSEVQALASDPTLVAIARNYFGCEPVLLGARIWWSFPSGAGAAQQTSLGQGFHYDLDGYRALAFFFYLTDVAPASGPHICVAGSHIKKPLKSLLSLYKARTDAEIDSWYGKERQVTLCGSAGFGFAEDIFLFPQRITSAARRSLDAPNPLRDSQLRQSQQVRRSVTLNGSPRRSLKIR